MKKLIVGGAGFIGSALVKKLSIQRHEIIVIDKLSLGSKKNIKDYPISFYKADINNIGAVLKILKKHKNIDEIWHLAANSDIPSGVSSIDVDLKDTFMSTVSILRIMKIIKCKRIYFASSSAIYGINKNKLHEKMGPLFPISNYGAMKLSSEALLSASLETYVEKVCIYRFPNVVGVPATHGVILDFMKKLRKNKKTLNVLGNGLQKKAYLHVDDLINAMCFINDKTKKGMNYFNIGPDDNGVLVSRIAEEVVKLISPQAKINYQTTDRGWPGDVPNFSYSINKLSKLGWSPTMSSLDAIKKAIRQIALQENLIE